MNKEKLLKILKLKEERKAALVAKANSTEDIKELRSINSELDGLNIEIDEFTGMIAEIEAEEARNAKPPIDPNIAAMDPPSNIDYNGVQKRNQPIGGLNPLATYGGQQTQNEGDTRAELTEKYETRGADLKAKKAVTFNLKELPEFRAVTIGGGGLIVPTQYDNTLNPTFNQVSAVIDKVSAIPYEGGNAYQKGFEVTYGEGDYTTETGDYKDTDPETDYVDINKAKITAYTEISDEAIKLPNINYQSLVAKNIGISLRKKMTKQILVGTGGTNTLTGIFNAPENVIPSDTDLEISEIDADTLDNIVFGYGGDEDVEGSQYLILNKKDLAAFARIRDADGKKLYKITLNGNEGTISSSDSYAVPFIINSAVAPLSVTETPVETYCMAYGMLHCYELPIFSQITVEESRDYKFKSGQIAYRGSVWAGGNVAMYKGFVRIKKKA